MIKKLKTSIYSRYIIFREKVVFKVFNYKKLILIEGYPESVNFGDALNKPLVELLSKKKVVFSKYIQKNSKLKSYSVIGSVIQSIPSETIIWGSGIISENVKNIKKPKKVYAVRGPKTRQLLLENGVDCPKVYGDPALLLPLIYYPKCDKKYKVGIIPHYLDKENKWIKKYKGNKEFNIIDLEVGSDYRRVVRELLNCEKIITSSLHGLIISYAYGLPSCWVKFSDKVIGGNFKFNDFLLSINEKEREPIIINDNIEFSDLLFHTNSNLKYYDIKPLIQACPFIDEEMKIKLLDKANTMQSCNTL